MNNSILDLLGSPSNFLDKLFGYLSEKKIAVSNFELDHICYRVETEERYQALKIALSNLGELLTESQIGGRVIASIKLNDPIIYKNRKIEVVELPAPKQGSFYKEGFEHKKVRQSGRYLKRDGLFCEISSSYIGVCDSLFGLRKFLVQSLRHCLNFLLLRFRINHQHIPFIHNNKIIQTFSD